jgi:zinc ribbon protein
VFCPNCGAENKDTSAPCIRCGFKLSGLSASKFKGTMMLNSDESVQELIEAQRRKMQEGKTPEAAAPPEPSPPPADPGTPAAPDGGGVPRPRRKLGGATILGVAPQIGGFKGAPEAGTLESPQHPTPPAPPARSPSAPPADPNAPTEAMQAFTPGAAFGSTVIGGTAPQPVVPEPAPVAARGTQPLQQQPAAAPAGAAFQTQASPRAALDSPSPNRTVPLQQVPEPPQDPAHTTAPLPAQAAAVAREAPVSSLPPIKKSISAGELFLVVATCGLYGIWRMLRRKDPG